MAQYRKDTHSYLDNGTTIFEVNMLADKDGNIINSFGAAANVPIAAGDVDGYQRVHKFGMINGTSSSSWSTVWTAGEISGNHEYPWSLSANTLTVVSTSTQDAAAGSGALTIRVEGLDSSYNFLSEDFTMTGQSATSAGAETFLRVNRAYVLTGNTNVGRIDVKNGTTIVTSIEALHGQTMQCIYTVPAGKTAYLSSMQVTSSKQQTVIASMFQRPFGGAFRINASTSLYSSGHTINFDIPDVLTEKTDIDLRVLGSSGQVVSADFELLLVDN